MRCDTCRKCICVSDSFVISKRREVGLLLETVHHTACLPPPSCDSLEHVAAPTTFGQTVRRWIWMLIRALITMYCRIKLWGQLRHIPASKVARSLRTVRDETFFVEHGLMIRRREEACAAEFVRLSTRCPTFAVILQVMWSMGGIRALVRGDRILGCGPVTFFDHVGTGFCVCVQKGVRVRQPRVYRRGEGRIVAVLGESALLDDGDVVQSSEPRGDPVSFSRFTPGVYDILSCSHRFGKRHLTVSAQKRADGSLHQLELWVTSEEMGRTFLLFPNGEIIFQTLNVGHVYSHELMLQEGMRIACEAGPNGCLAWFGSELVHVPLNLPAKTIVASASVRTATLWIKGRLVSVKNEMAPRPFN